MGTYKDTRSFEIQRLATAEPPTWCKAARLAERFVVRILRLVIALVLVGLAIWLFRISADILDRPFASLSPLALIGGILAGIGGLSFSLGSLGVAFGPAGPSRVETSWRNSQADTVQSRRRMLGYDD